MAFTITFTERSTSQLSSAKIWLMPNPPMITGIDDCSWHMRCSFSPPRGMSTEIYSLCLSIAPISSRSGLETNDTAAGATACFLRTFSMISCRIELVRMHSDPPLSTQALPDFKHNAAISTVTFGRDSKITPTTPSGTVCL